MKRKIRTYGGYFESFMQQLTEKEQEKVHRKRLKRLHKVK